MTFEVLPYQHRIAEHIVNHPAALVWADIGLRKTATTLMALRQLRDAGELMAVLIIAPKRVRDWVWEQQKGVYEPTLDMRVIRGTPEQRKRAVAHPAMIKVASRDDVTWLVRTYGKRWPWNVVVIDEAQDFKEHGAMRFKALATVRQHFDRVIELSATPATEGLQGLWSQVYLADGGKRLGPSYTAFEQAFFTKDYMGFNMTPDPGAEEKIHARVADLAISLSADDYLSLPPYMPNVIEVEMTPEEQARYDELEREELLQVGADSVTVVNAAVMWGKLRQIATGAVYSDDKTLIEFSSAKIEALAEIVAGTNDNLLVFYGYRHEVDRILRAFPQAQELDEELWCAGRQRIALAHADSAGAGLNLQTGGHTIVWTMPPASLRQYLQANGRLRRGDQQHPVVVHELVAVGTTDVDVRENRLNKQLGQTALLNHVALARRKNKKAPEGAPIIRPEDF